MNSTNETVNLTAIFLSPNWTAVPIFTLLAFLVSLFGNALLLMVFARNRSLRSPFNIYIMNLLIANLSVIIIQYPLDVVLLLYSTWIPGDGACTAYIYADIVLQGAILNSHQLIAINRIWAVVRPVSYRNHHNNKAALLICLVMWVYVHLALAPGWISDATVYRKRPVTKNGCLINESAQPVWHIFTQLLIFDLPEITMVLAFPIIHFTRLLRRRKTLLPVNDDILPVAGSQGTEQTGASNRRRSSALRGTQVAPPGVAGSGFNQALSKYRNSLGVPPTGQGFGRDRRARLFHSKGYVVLMLLTVSVTVCWTPIAMFYNLITFMTFGSPMLYEVGTMLFMCQTMLDPIIFTLALKKLRRALREFIPFG